MFHFFRKKKPIALPLPLQTDMHSHLIPGVDDGVDTYAKAQDLIDGFEELGYRKLITTPHIMKDIYDNSEQKLKDALSQLHKEIKTDVQIEVAAEYYLDETLYEKVSSPETELLTFGDRYLLFETPFMNEPLNLKEFIFAAKSRGLQPILAHPERYSYLHSNTTLINDLLDRGVLFQVNINSFTGYYSTVIKKTAERLVKDRQVHFLGSDCHNSRHMHVIHDAIREKYFKKALDLPLLNYQL